MTFRLIYFSFLIYLGFRLHESKTAEIELGITSLQQKYQIVLEQNANVESDSWIPFSKISTSDQVCGKTLELECNVRTESDTFQSSFEDIGSLCDKEEKVKFSTGNITSGLTDG